MAARDLISELHVAVSTGNLQSVLTLLEDPSADVVSAEGRGRTLLHTACEAGKSEIVEALLSGGFRGQASVDAQDLVGKTPLMLAVENRHHNVVNYLLERGDTGLFHLDALGESAMIYAAYNGDVEMMQLLEKYGAELHDSDSKGLTTLHYACIQKYREVALHLLSKGAPINKSDTNGNTALHSSLIYHSDCARILLACGADTTMVNNEKETPLNIAQRLNNQYYIRLIEVMRNQVLTKTVQGDGQQFLFALNEKLNRIEQLSEKESELTKKYELQVLKETNAATTERNLEKEIIRSRLLRQAVTASDIDNIKPLLT